MNMQQQKLNKRMFLPEGAGEMPHGTMATCDAQRLGVEHGRGDGAVLTDGESQKRAEDGVDGGGRKVIEIQPGWEKLWLDIFHRKVVW